MNRTRPDVSRKRPTRSILLAALALLLPTAASDAADILVTSDADSGPGTLRTAIETAAPGDRIVFDIAGTPTITLASDLPAISDDVAFANNNPTDVTIDRNGNGPLLIQGGAADLSTLNITDGIGGPSTDIQGAAGTTFFGADRLSANISSPGTIAPGTSPLAGNIGTFTLTGDLDASGGSVAIDVQSTAGPIQNDLIDVDGVFTVTGATLQPNFIGGDFQAGDNILFADSTNPIVGTFNNQADVFDLPENPFLEAVVNSSNPNQFAFDVQDNNASFSSVTAGCNQLSAAAALDAFRARATPPPAIDDLRNGSATEVALAIEQLSGAIYPSLIGAEINHIQSNLHSVRDHLAVRLDPKYQSAILIPWVRGYGVEATADPDDCLTTGYRHEIGGVELGTTVILNYGLSAFGYTHVADSSLSMQLADQQADIESYRGGAGIQYVGANGYLLATGGGGFQDYEVRRSLDQFTGSTFAQSSFDGSSSFGYLELGTLVPHGPGTCNPYAALQSVRVETDPITESGDPTFALLSDAVAEESLRGSLGVAYDRTGLTPLGPARSRLRVAWQHEFLDTITQLPSVFVDDNPAPIALQSQSVSLGRDWALVGYELEWAIFRYGQLTAGYQGQFNSRSAFNSFLAGVERVW